jgi:adenylate cyclase
MTLARAGTARYASLVTGVPRNCVVLFVDISGSSRLYRELGDRTAMGRVRDCLDLLRKVVEEGSGRVIKHIGDGLMCDFVDADGALNAATAMLIAVERAGGGKVSGLRVHVGCHFGPVIENAGDVFGHTVNVAAGVAGVARVGQIITTFETAERLSEALQQNVRLLDRVSLKGLHDEVAVYEFLWQERHDDLTVAAPAAARGRGPRLRLAFAGREICLDPSGPGAITLGRLATCDVSINDAQASREHATIKAHGDRFVLVDHSSNGTYMTWTEGEETCLRRTEAILPNRGKLALGSSTQEAHVTVVEFSCES